MGVKASGKRATLGGQCQRAVGSHTGRNGVRLPWDSSAGTPGHGGACRIFWVCKRGWWYKGEKTESIVLLREKYYLNDHPEAGTTVWWALSSSQQAGSCDGGEGLHPCSVVKLITTNRG